MKEHTYGWYPSAKNVYTDRRMGAPTPYQLEALYRFRDSKYYEPPITPPEQKSSKPPRATPTPTSFRRPTSTMSHASKVSQKSKSDKDVYSHVRARSVPIHTAYKQPPRLELPMPQQCWSTHVPETEITVFPPSASPAPDYSAQVPKPTPSPSQPIEDTTTTKRERIQSARISREKSSRPERPVKSAGPVRPTPTLQSPKIPESPVPRPPSSKSCKQSYSRPQSRASSRPKAPSPYQMEALEELDRPETPDYFDECRKRGWMMEVHGDPLKLKKVTERLPYTVKVAEPETERDPPKIHMENIETFFLNTIPRRPMAFTIDKEWISEMIHAKRMAVQKKHGINYRYKNFSFVY